MESEFEDHLERVSNGCFLYLKLTLDMIEKGHLVIKSNSFSVLPVSLFEVFLLEFNLKFSSKKSFQKAANILSLCIASLHPLNLTQIYQIIRSQSVASSSLSWNEFLSDFKVLAETLIVRRNNTVMFFHPAFRDWIIERSNSKSGKFVCDLRAGHSTMALHQARSYAGMDSETTLDLCHHILKGQLFRNTQALTQTRYLQSLFVSMSSEDVSASLGSHRNLYNPSVSISRLLLLAGASPDSVSCSSPALPLLCHYSQQGHTDMVELLLVFGAEVDIQDSGGRTALSLAAAAGHLECVRLLVERSAKLYMGDNAGNTPLLFSVQHGHYSVMEYLVTADWSDRLGEAAQQATVAAASAGQTNIMQFLLDMSEVDINAIDTLTRETPLTAAAKAGEDDCCKELLARGATVNTPNSRGETSLYAASKTGHWAITKLLLIHGASVKDQDCLGRTSLIAAAKEGYLAIVELLLSNGSSLDETDKDKVTPLMWACAEGRITTARYLVGEGAAIHATEKHGRTALDLAAYKGDPEIIQLLIEQGAMVGHVDLNGMCPLDRAITCNNIEAVKCFLRKGAKLGPSTWAMAESKPDIMLILLNKLLEDGNMLFKKGRIDEASQRYTYAMNRVPNINHESYQSAFELLSMHLLLNQSRCKRKLNNNTEAISLATEVLQSHPTSHQALYARAKAHHAARDLEAALKDLVAAVRAAPDNKDLLKLCNKVKHEIGAAGKK